MAQLARLDDLLGDAEVLVPAAVLVHGEEHVVLLRGRDHLVNLGQGHGHGLFGDDVLAGLHRGAGQLAVHVVGGGDQHDVEQVALQELVQRVKAGQADFAGLLHALGQDVVRRDHFDALHLGSVLQVPVSHVAKTDNTKFHTHCFILHPSMSGFASLLFYKFSGERPC